MAGVYSPTLSLWLAWTSYSPRGWELRVYFISHILCQGLHLPTLWKESIFFYRKTKATVSQVDLLNTKEIVSEVLLLDPPHLLKKKKWSGFII